MKFVEPYVYLIAESKIEGEQLKKMLTLLGESSTRFSDGKNPTRLQPIVS